MFNKDKTIFKRGYCEEVLAVYDCLINNKELPKQLCNDKDLLSVQIIDLYKRWPTGNRNLIKRKIEQQQKKKLRSFLIKQNFWEDKRKYNNPGAAAVISFEEAKKKLEHRKDIRLIESGYKGWSEKCLFWDSELDKEWWAVPKSVYNTNSVHLDKKQQKYEATCLKKYNVKNVSQLKEVKQKKKETCLVNWGYENNLLHPNINKQVREGWKEKFGTEYPCQSEQVKEKQRNSFKERYGEDNISKTDYYRRTVSERFIIETGEHVKDWLERQSGSKPAYISLCQNIPNKPISIDTVKTYIKNYKSNKTNLEVFTEKLLGIETYNKYVLGQRPDFKLSDKVYLNVDGLYWHCELNREKRYHFDLRKKFEDNGLRIFQFREDEVYINTNIVKSIIDCYLNNEGIFNIAANKCVISSVKQKEASQFLEENCLKGYVCSKHIGLYYNNELVLLVSYKKHKDTFIILRYCERNNCNIVSGFDYIFSFIRLSLMKPSISHLNVWIDLRYEFKLMEFLKGFINQREVIKYKLTNGKWFTNNGGSHKIWDAGQRLYSAEL